MKREICKYTFLLGLVATLYACDQKSGKTSIGAPTPIPPTTGDVYGGARVSFSFDDGRSCAFNSAIPVLDSLGLKSTNYIITRRLTGSDDYITVANVLSLESRGHEIGNHTRTHRDLTTLSPSEWQDEIEGAKQDLRGFGVNTIQTLAYPFGAYNSGLQAFISGSGYLSARSTDDGHTLKNTNPFALKRRNLGGNVTILDVENWLNTAIINREWIIFVVHHVENSPSEYSITPDFWKQVVNLVVSKRIPVVNVSEGVKAM